MFKQIVFFSPSLACKTYSKVSTQCECIVTHFGWPFSERPIVSGEGGPAKTQKIHRKNNNTILLEHPVAVTESVYLMRHEIGSSEIQKAMDLPLMEVIPYSTLQVRARPLFLCLFNWWEIKQLIRDGLWDTLLERAPMYKSNGPIQPPLGFYHLHHRHMASTGFQKGQAILD